MWGLQLLVYEALSATLLFCGRMCHKHTNTPWLSLSHTHTHTHTHTYGINSIGGMNTWLVQAMTLPYCFSASFSRCVLPVLQPQSLLFLTCLLLNNLLPPTFTTKTSSWSDGVYFMHLIYQKKVRLSFFMRHFWKWCWMTVCLHTLRSMWEKTALSSTKTFWHAKVALEKMQYDLIGHKVHISFLDSSSSTQFNLDQVLRELLPVLLPPHQRPCVMLLPPKRSTQGERLQGLIMKEVELP